VLPRYGVLSGTLLRSLRDAPDSQGRWFHVNVFVSAAAVEYRCAVDVDSHQSNTGVEWRVVNINAADIATVQMLSNDRISALFSATVQATEEAIVNALVAAETMTGANGRTIERLPHDRLKEVLKKYGR